MFVTMLQAYTQVLPTVCTGSRVRYAATPSPGFTNSSFRWTIKGAVDTLFYNATRDSVDVTWPLTNGVFEMTIQEVSEFGCEGDAISSLVSVEGTPVDIGIDVSICQGETHTFEDPTLTGDLQYLWQTGDTTRSLTIGYTDSVQLQITNEYNCRTLSNKVLLTVNPLPNFSLGADTSICGEETLELFADSTGPYYDWSTGAITQSIGLGPIHDSVYWVTVTNSNRCSFTDSIRILPCAPASENDVPNVITPDGNNYNDDWQIPRLENYPDATVEIYDRWGRVVFNTKGYRKNWDGKSNTGQKLPMDTYIYIIDLKDGSKPWVGTVTILR
jgi:gliding motility-associated-like protein